MSEKSPEAFRTISEVAEELDLPQHVLRFWETRFSQIKPMKRGGGRRYYRPEDVNLLRGIRHLLYGEGYTIKGVQRILKEQGVRYVMGVWLEGEAPEAHAAPAARLEPDPGDVEEADRAPSATEPQADPPGLLSEAESVASARSARPPTEAPFSVAKPAEADIYAPKPRTQRVGEPVSIEVAPGGGLSAEQTRQLKAALFELMECKRLLDDVRR
ncbi:MerR-like DNA binding protein [Tepidamorphus gemmatus]|uniref:MerR-like DNA binding protein n=1 Tax=Tepidamorphus gemmatus TaxID=747076 RepID=A0A4R3MGK2_9HYPH|nr:MerR family transcriptional regulator [Tepidamorphus gemmatus]TCT11479.1 MerR-like DNA binding protein [Tepidamorphus gemmatus]